MAHHPVIAKCPFYNRENQTTIYCESDVALGSLDGMRYTAHIFENSREKMEFMRLHCGKYPDMECPYAAFMNQHYGGKQNEKENQKENQKEKRETDIYQKAGGGKPLSAGSDEQACAGGECEGGILGKPE